MVHSFRITILTIVIIKTNFIKVYTIRVYIIAKECNNIRGYIIKEYIIFKKYSIINCFNHYTRNKPVKSVSVNFESFFLTKLKKVFFYIDSRLDENKNRSILETPLTYIKISERFSRFLFKWNNPYKYPPA